MQLFGLLKTFSVGDALQWVASEQATGVLVFQQKDREKRIYLLNGEIVAGLSTDPAEFYGQFLLVEGRLAEEQLVAAVFTCQQDGKLLGEALTDLGFLEPAEIEKSLREHLNNLVCDLFLWQGGLFYFTPQDVADKIQLEEPLHTVSTMMEGVRWVDELARLRQILPHDQVALQPGPGWPGEKLSAAGRRIVGLALENAKLGELRQRVGGSYFHFLQATVELVNEQVLEIADLGQYEEVSREEISYLDFMLEQAVADRRASFGDLVPIHTELLEELYPWRITKAGSSEPEDEAIVSLLGELDGNRRLGELLSEDHSERSDQLHALVLALRKNSLALLPVPRAELKREDS